MKIDDQLSIAESCRNNVIGTFQRLEDSYQRFSSEDAIEDYVVNQLIKLGYEHVQLNYNNIDKNLRTCLENLNNCRFGDSEWIRFYDEVINSPLMKTVDCIARIQDEKFFDFLFDNGTRRNLMLIDKDNLTRNHLQVCRQFVHFNEQSSKTNRYDVVVLVNGLPLVQIELKNNKLVREAYDQFCRYSKDTFNSPNSLFKYLHLMVISNGLVTRYFSNNLSNPNSKARDFEFTITLADKDNVLLDRIEDFVNNFFDQNRLLQIICNYCVFNSDKELLVLRPYQICAIERVLGRIKSSYYHKLYGKGNESGGYIWHTTGSGKTLTSFKAAQLAYRLLNESNLPLIDKVIFVVDRKDLDIQTVKEYKKFDEDSVFNTNNTKHLDRNLSSEENKIIVTTIQKLNKFCLDNKNHPVRNKHCVFIFDECHRSQFGIFNNNIRKLFKKFYFFGFTGTPIFDINSKDGQTTSSIFGNCLHRYRIADALNDNKVLPFKLDYCSCNPQFIKEEKGFSDYIVKVDDDKDKKLKLTEAMLNDSNRLESIATHILDVFDEKTRRDRFHTLAEKRRYGFNAMFAVSSIDTAIKYYSIFKELQKNRKEKLNIFTIFSTQPNAEQSCYGDVEEEKLHYGVSGTQTKHDQLKEIIDDYNSTFNCNYSVSNDGFYGFYQDVSRRLKDLEIDLLIVVGMFLTGYDSKTINTLFLDKNLRFHSLLQAFSRTNRIYKAHKPYGNIVCFRDLESATNEALLLFAGGKDSCDVVLARPFNDYFYGYSVDGKHYEGYEEVVKTLADQYTYPFIHKTAEEKRDFVHTFNKVLRLENILRNYDEFKDKSNDLISSVGGPTFMDDAMATYYQIKEDVKSKKNLTKENLDLFADVVWETSLDKTVNITVDYIFELIPTLILEKIPNANFKSLPDDIKNSVFEFVNTKLLASENTRHKQNLIFAFLNQCTDFSADAMKKDFYPFKEKLLHDKISDLISEHNLNNENDIAFKFLSSCIDKGELLVDGTEFSSVLGKVSRLNGEYDRKKEKVSASFNELINEYGGLYGE